MNIFRSFLYTLCCAVFFSFALQAQGTTTPKKVPQLSMDDFDSRVSAEKPSANTEGKPTELPPSNAKMAVEAAWKKMASLKSGRMKFSSQAAGGANEMLYEFAPARVRMVKDGVEMIVIGAAVYLRAQGQEWKKSTKEQIFKSADVSFKAFTNFSAEKIAQIQLVGEDTLNQFPVLKYKVIETNDSTSYMWIGKADGLVYKMEASFAGAGQAVTMTFSDLNADITIASPEPEN